MKETGEKKKKKKLFLRGNDALVFPFFFAGVSQERHSIHFCGAFTNPGEYV